MNQSHPPHPQQITLNTPSQTLHQLTITITITNHDYQ